MNAPKISSSNRWETENEERLIFLFEKSISLIKLITKKMIVSIIAVLNVLTFVAYKLILTAGLCLRTAFLTAPIVRVEREESWLYRQVR